MNPKQLVESKSVQYIYRDCLKLAKRMMNDQQKIMVVRNLLKKQFMRHKQVFEEDHIHLLKMNAVKGISNYIIFIVQKEHLENPKLTNIFTEKEQEIQLSHKKII